MCDIFVWHISLKLRGFERWPCHRPPAPVAKSLEEEDSEEDSTTHLEQCPRVVLSSVRVIDFGVTGVGRIGTNQIESDGFPFQVFVQKAFKIGCTDP